MLIQVHQCLHLAPGTLVLSLSHTHTHTYSHTDQFFLNELKVSCGHFGPLLLNTSVYISHEKGWSYITTVK